MFAVGLGLYDKRFCLSVCLLDQWPAFDNPFCLVEWKRFAVSINASLSRIHFMSMSSINLSHENGFRLTDCSSCYSSLPMNILAYDGANFVPMAVP